MFSLRWRLVAVALGVASVGLIAANVVVYGVVRNDLNTRIDRQLLDFSGRRLLFRAVDAAANGRSAFGGQPTPGRTPNVTTVTSGVSPAPGSLPVPSDGERRPPRAAFETYAEIRDAAGLLVVGPQRFSASEDSAPDPLKLPKALGKPPQRPKIFESSELSSLATRQNTGDAILMTKHTHTYI